MGEDLSLSQADYAAILRRHDWIRSESVDPHASLSRGWEPLFVEMLDALDGVMARITVDHPGAKVTEFTTKSKMGSLRTFFRLEGVTGPGPAVWPLLRASIERAEGSSARTCESCGGAGRLRDVDGWLSTLCDAHGAVVAGPL